MAPGSWRPLPPDLPSPGGVPQSLSVSGLEGNSFLHTFQEEGCILETRSQEHPLFQVSSVGLLHTWVGVGRCLHRLASPSCASKV